MKTKVRNNIDCCIVEVKFPDTGREQLDSLLDYLVELLAEERSREFENMEVNDGQ